MVGIERTGSSFGMPRIGISFGMTEERSVHIRHISNKRKGQGNIGRDQRRNEYFHDCNGSSGEELIRYRKGR
jgi:hypothetical protein